MKKFTICCDMDDTIEDLLGAWTTWLNNKYNLNVKVSDIASWTMNVSYPTLTDDQIFEPLYIPEFWDGVLPKLESQKYLKKLIDDGHNVYICTNTHYAILKEKMERCLFYHFPFINWRKIITMRDKQMIRCDYLIDDGVHNIVGDYIGLLIDMPHNQNFSAENVFRVYNFEEVYNIINEAANS